jgi:hypothetical protein
LSAPVLIPEKEITYMKKSVVLLAVCLPVFAFGQVAESPQSASEDLSANTNNEPPMLGIHWARGFHPSARLSQAKKGGGSPNMTYHGGKIMTTA